LPWYNEHPSECPLVWIDTETGGLDASRAALLEVAIITTDFTGTHVRDRWSARLLPFHDDIVEDDVSAINGYNPALWEATAIEPRIAYKAIQERIQGAIIAGHNPRFDREMILRFLARFHVKRWPGPRYMADTAAMAWPLLAAQLVPNLKLTTLTGALGIHHEAAHSAMADCEAARQLYCELRWIFDHGISDYFRLTPLPPREQFNDHQEVTGIPG
jgi:DNA polymerase III subunit epsilon